jgi:hypothetical protein
MQSKGGTSAAVATVEEVEKGLARHDAWSPEEEKVLRMRYGVREPGLRQPLPRAAGGNVEVADELLFIEMQLLKASRARAGAQAMGREVPADSRSKEKIIRALRRKK